MTKKCPFMSGIATIPKTTVGELAFTSAQIGKLLLIECIEGDCKAWEIEYSIEDTGLIVGGHCKLIDRKCH